MDAISLLKQDHQKVRQLLKRLTSNGTEELLEQVEAELKVHTQIEEEIFYPAFKDSIRSEKDAHIYYEALEEHHVVDLVLPEIKSSSEGSDQFEAKAKVLKDLVEHHAEEEESQMFPKARKAMGAARLRELGEELRERKEELMGGTSGGSSMFERMLRPGSSNGVALRSLKRRSQAAAAVRPFREVGENPVDAHSRNLAISAASFTVHV
jgi:hemerythrin-like domain-containing protein